MRLRRAASRFESAATLGLIASWEKVLRTSAAPAGEPRASGALPQEARAGRSSGAAVNAVVYETPQPRTNSHGYGVTHDVANIHCRRTLSTPSAGAPDRRFPALPAAARKPRARASAGAKSLEKGG